MKERKQKNIHRFNQRSSIQGFSMNSKQLQYAHGAEEKIAKRFDKYFHLFTNLGNRLSTFAEKRRRTYKNLPKVIIFSSSFFTSLFSNS